MAIDGADRRPARDAAIFGVAIVLGLMTLDVLRHPASLRGGGLSTAIIGTAILLLDGAAAVWVGMRPAGPARAALGRGAVIGLGLGAVQVGHLFLEHFADPGPSLGAALGGGSMGLMIGAFGLAATAGHRRTGSPGPAVLAAVWCATVAVLLSCAAGFATDLAFMDRLARGMAAGFAGSGMTDPRAFVVRSTMESAAMHLLAMPTLAAAVGLVAGMACEALRPARRQTAIAFAGLVVVLLGLGIGSIRYGLALERPRRPPFILSGMLLGGLALACAGPALAAAGSPSSGSGHRRSPGPTAAAGDPPAG